MKSHCRIEDLRFKRISYCCVANQLQGAKAGSRKTSLVAIAEFRVKEDSGWNEGDSCVVSRLGYPM